MRIEIDNFSFINAKRAQEFGFGKNGQNLESLPEIYWSNALCGEAGELANMIKKRHLGKEIPTKDVLKEIADIVTYADILCTKLGGKLSDVLVEKFNEVSDRHGCEIKIPDYGSSPSGSNEHPK